MSQPLLFRIEGYDSDRVPMTLPITRSTSEPATVITAKLPIYPLTERFKYAFQRNLIALVSDWIQRRTSRMLTTERLAALLLNYKIAAHV